VPDGISEMNVSLEYKMPALLPLSLGMSAVDIDCGAESKRGFCTNYLTNLLLEVAL
jgi:hypothetical protein